MGRGDRRQQTVQGALIGLLNTEWISQSPGVAEIPFMRVWHKRIINEVPATDSKRWRRPLRLPAVDPITLPRRMNASGRTKSRAEEEKKMKRIFDEAENNIPSPEVQISVSR